METNGTTVAVTIVENYQKQESWFVQHIMHNPNVGISVLVLLAMLFMLFEIRQFLKTKSGESINLNVNVQSQADIQRQIYLQRMAKQKIGHLSESDQANFSWEAQGKRRQKQQEQLRRQAKQKKLARPQSYQENLKMKWNYQKPVTDYITKEKANNAQVERKIIKDDGKSRVADIGKQSAKQKTISDIFEGELPSIVLNGQSSKQSFDQKTGKRSNERKPTIEMKLFDIKEETKQNDKKNEQQKIEGFGSLASFGKNQMSKLFNNGQQASNSFFPNNQIQKEEPKPQLINNQENKKDLFGKPASGASLFENVNQNPNVQELKKTTETLPSLFAAPLPPQPSIPQPQSTTNAPSTPASMPIVINPSPSQPPTLSPGVPQSSRPEQSRSVPKARPQKLTPEEFLESYIKFAGPLKEQIAISTKMQNMNGARSSPNEILTQARSLINTIDKSDDKQIVTFGVKLFQTVVFKFINNSNVKSGLERIPPKSRTDQCEKNSINCYVLAINMFRMMPGCKKVWVIVFGKLLKMLDFIYKRKTDLQSYHKLELIQSGYIRKYKEIHSKYLSRIDFLVYMLFALTSYDPLLVVRMVELKDRNVQKARVEMESWGTQWSYSEFWSLSQAIFANKHESYFKPIVYMNILYTLYPRIFEHKRRQSQFKEEFSLFMVTMVRAKKYLQGLKKMKEMKILSECDENDQLNYQYDGDDFVKSIKVLDNRIPEKGIEIKLRVQEYDSKANVFYYFTKEK